ncbi:ABC transporter substrate-binding protein [Auraticoccus monumenti]|uniref:Carbohydrate ABC transporter substrate-binding protein, CUT1 family n=1 Tax=Auraticoccus monumenti TaxID=675864 RepID=A0A1G6YPT9_9ACTN|nr:ABC transporter substrate-binding protein [Auraticoccus monumenti]SDD92524.1 carbohydrate ABC transporter substrate-binding protein, CUT1 family [Auraticoccus monumenti]
MKSRHALVHTAVAGLLLSALTACSGGGGDDRTVLEFQTALAADAPMLTVLEEITSRYEAEHPDVDVDLRTGGNDYEAQIKVRLAARDVPDIWATHGWSQQRYGAFLAPLQDEPWAQGFNPALDTAMRGEDGTFYALPVTTDVAGLVVNRDALTEVGVDPDAITTWEDFVAAGEALVAQDRVALTLAGSKSGSAGNAIDWLAPGAFSEAELASMTAGDFPQDAYARLLGVLDQWRADGWINPDYSSATSDDMAQALAQGKAAFALSNNSLISQAWEYDPEADLAFIPIPAMLGGDPYLIGGEGTAFGAAKDGDDLEEAKDYLAFLAQPDNTSALAASVGTLPGLTDAEPRLGELESSFEQYVIPNELPLAPYFDRVYLPNGMWETVVSTADGVIAGQSSPADAAAQVATDFDTLYGQSQ